VSYFDVLLLTLDIQFINAIKSYKHMRTIFKTTAAVMACIILVTACRKGSKTDPSTTISEETLTKIHQLGFSNKNVKTDEDGNYIVESDILLTKENLDSKPELQVLRVGSEEQYCTGWLVKRLPRTLRVGFGDNLPAIYVAALDEAIARYNALGLQIRFSRVTSNVNISILASSGDYLASAGFPLPSGNPYPFLRVNSTAIGNQPQATIATILAHELGHCIGFRHTDYMDRSFSCGGSPVNEGGDYPGEQPGANLVPGTPAGPDPNSWMLACIGSFQNRPFNANDITALQYRY
jgi:hypothetical protein